MESINKELTETKITIFYKKSNIRHIQPLKLTKIRPNTDAKQTKDRACANFHGWHEYFNYCYQMLTKALKRSPAITHKQ